MEEINVMSLFDGIACGYQALKEAGIKVKIYYASEIDKNAIKIAKKNHPDIIELGDINDINFNDFIGKVDLIMGGSPCQDLSIAGKRKGLKGERSGLFYKFVEAIETIKPKYFLLENNVGMPQEAYEEMSRLMGCYPIEINSALVSAQTRKRFYWTNIGHKQYNLFGFPTVDIPQPEDKGILLKDVLERGTTYQDKSFVVTSNEHKGTTLKDNLEKHRRTLIYESVVTEDKAVTIKAQYAKSADANFLRQGTFHATGVFLKIPENTVKGYAEINQGECMDLTHLNSKTRRGRAMKEKCNCLQTQSEFYQYLEPIRIGQYGKGGQGQRIYSVRGKSVSLSTNGGGMGSNTGLYKIDLPDGEYLIRKLTPLECERLQTLPDNYTKGIADSNRYKCIGNGWTVAVIAYIFSYLREETWN